LNEDAGNADSLILSKGHSGCYKNVEKRNEPRLMPGLGMRIPTAVRQPGTEPAPDAVVDTVAIRIVTEAGLLARVGVEGDPIGEIPRGGIPHPRVLRICDLDEISRVILIRAARVIRHSVNVLNARLLDAFGSGIAPDLPAAIR
jgi:hypothetical protein